MGFPVDDSVVVALPASGVFRKKGGSDAFKATRFFTAIQPWPPGIEADGKGGYALKGNEVKEGDWVCGETVYPAKVFQAECEVVPEEPTGAEA